MAEDPDRASRAHVQRKPSLGMEAKGLIREVTGQGRLSDCWRVLSQIVAAVELVA